MYFFYLKLNQWCFIGRWFTFSLDNSAWIRKNFIRHSLVSHGTCSRIKKTTNQKSRATISLKKVFITINLCFNNRSPQCNYIKFVWVLKPEELLGCLFFWDSLLHVVVFQSKRGMCGPVGQQERINSFPTISFSICPLLCNGRLKLLLTYLML
jgi:hypothetical protein